jgi:hypothetical protein
MYNIKLAKLKVKKEVRSVDNQNEFKDTIDYNIIEKMNEKESINVLKDLDVFKLYDLWYEIEFAELENEKINKEIFYNIFYIKRKELFYIF